MATQGLLTILNHSTGLVTCKVVFGCDGHTGIPKLARLVQKNRVIDPDKLFRMACKYEIGCQRCLVVMSADQITEPDLPTRWQDTFQVPDFSPRCESGITNYFEYLFVEDILEGSRRLRTSADMVCKFNTPYMEKYAQDAE